MTNTTALGLKLVVYTPASTQDFKLMSNSLAYGPKVSFFDKHSSLLVSVEIIDKQSSLQPKGLNIKKF